MQLTRQKYFKRFSLATKENAIIIIFSSISLTIVFLFYLASPNVYTGKFLFERNFVFGERMSMVFLCFFFFMVTKWGVIAYFPNAPRQCYKRERNDETEMKDKKHSHERNGRLQNKRNTNRHS